MLFSQLLVGLNYINKNIRKRIMNTNNITSSDKSPDLGGNQ